MEEAGDQGSYVVTQCFSVKIKGCEVRVVGNQGRDNTNNCMWDTSSRCQGGQPCTLTLGPHGVLARSSPRAIEGGWLYCFSFTSRAQVVPEALSQVVN